MANIYTALNIAKTSMMASQMGLAVSSHNVANANSPNFSRQGVTLEASDPVSYNGLNGMIGTGVKTGAVIRYYNSFLETERNSNISDTSYYEQRTDYLSRVESVFNESSHDGLSSMINSFFSNIQEIANDPGSIPKRTSLIYDAKQLGTFFKQSSQSLQDKRMSLNSSINSSIEKINQITDGIVKLNKIISETEAKNVTANDLRDQREKLLRDLSSYTKITTVEDSSNNEVTVYLSTGRPLVIGESQFELKTRANSNDPLSSSIILVEPSGDEVDITSEITSGSVGASLELRDYDIKNQLDALNILAATVAQDVNNLHQQGYGLDGSTGLDFFNPPTPSSYADSNNEGMAQISLSLHGPDKLIMNKLEIVYDGATYSLNDTTLDKSILTAVPLSDVVDHLEERGITVGITGTKVAGDRFIIDISNNAASSFSVTDKLLADSSKFAAGLTTGDGNGENATRLAKLDSKATMLKDSTTGEAQLTYSEYYDSLVARIGMETEGAELNYKQQESIAANIEAQHQQISGVSLDEEMIDVIKFQTAYQMSAKIIDTVTEMLDELMSITA
ncbi:MAG: flagellar hook-associated protein FlgK [Nitrospinota bacterium]